MNLTLNKEIAEQYKSNSQKARIITETWMVDNMFCPTCGNATISHFTANRPVADFFCPCCRSEFELKSSERKTDSFQRVIPDGAYDTMISRINSFNNPHLFVMAHYKQLVNNLIFIPNFFFIPEIIIKRPPLQEPARRAGWEGCNIDASLIPNHAKIAIIRNGEVVPQNKVVSQFNALKSLQLNSLAKRDWIIDTMNCIDKIPDDEFCLNDIYAFENELRYKHPNNNFIRAKLRQQLQLLRDKGLIEFVSRGRYKKKSI